MANFEPIAIVGQACILPGALDPASLWQAVRDGGRMLRRGARGDLVRELQRRLVAAGMQIAVDGDFGPATQRAVKQLQQRLGEMVDGIVGPKTAAHL